MSDFELRITTALERPNRRVHRQEHPRLPALAAAMLGVRDDRLADVAGQRQTVAVVGLAVDGHFPGPPIEVVDP